MRKITYKTKVNERNRPTEDVKDPARGSIEARSGVKTQSNDVQRERASECQIAW